ncbi:MAG: Rieske (2Fe-2S) protein [Chloroflexi bacterium]|nr:Rieske (2Fe-2S) protein [Chloroflexota bacterium]MBV9545851.1 Rieske (2Fe-2S) protein [Chloroflexota bacterium]
MKHVVARLDELPPGTRKIVDVAGISIGIFNVRGELFALRNRCPHQGGPLCEGLQWGLLESPVPGEFVYRRQGEILTCGWHGWEFDMRTGQSWCDPRRLRVRAYDVHVESGGALQADTRVKGPYMAETYPVATDGEYIVVELERGSSAR